MSDGVCQVRVGCWRSSACRMMGVKCESHGWSKGAGARDAQVLTPVHVVNVPRITRDFKRIVGAQRTVPAARYAGAWIAKLNGLAGIEVLTRLLALV